VARQTHDSSEAVRLVAYYLALQQHTPPPATRRPLTWDQHLLAGMAAAGKLSAASSGSSRARGMWAALGAFVAAKLAGGLQAHPLRFSDVVWSCAGMGAAMLALGALAAAATALPVVGAHHQAGLPLLLGSFGMLAVLLFGKPEAEPVRLWPLVAGQLGSAAIAVGVLQLCGPGLASRAAAMAATLAWMMHADCIHPPGGALVLLAMDSAAVQAMHWAWLLWPSLALSLGLLLPLSAATNWLRRSVQFDAPWAAAASAAAATLAQKQAEYAAQRDAKQAAMLRHFVALELDRGGSGVQLLHLELQPRPNHEGLLARLLAPLAQLLRWPLAAARHKQQQQQRRLVWRLPLRRPSGQPSGWGAQECDTHNAFAGGSSDGDSSAGDNSARDAAARLNHLFSLGRSVHEAGAGEAAAAAALDAAIRKRLLREAERRALEAERALEDREHRRRLWGGPEPLTGLQRFEDKLRRLQEERDARDSSAAAAAAGDGVVEQWQDAVEQQQQQQQDGSSTAAPAANAAAPASPSRRRLEAHWRHATAFSAVEGLPGGGSAHRGVMGSFAPDDE
jgi:hypothetical protein